MESGKVHIEILPVEEETPKAAAAAAATERTETATRRVNTEPPPQQQLPREELQVDRNRSACGQVTQITLRVLAVASMGAAFLIMYLAEQTADVGGYKIRASYRVSPTFKFFLCGTGTVCLYSMASVPMVYCCYRTRYVQFLDIIMMAVAMASASSATAVGYIAKFGNDAAGWAKSCKYYERYCFVSMVALACSYLGFACLLVICTSSTNSPATRTRRS